MRGSDERAGFLFSYVDLEARVRSDHPLRPIREIANAALADLTEAFDRLYPPRLGRPSIPPERLLRAMLLQAFYGIRSERRLMERMEFDLLFRWFVGLGVDDRAWYHSSFTKNRDRLLDGEIVAKFLQAVLAQPKVKRLMSSDHFSVDGTLIEAWASIKSFRRIDGDDNDPDGGTRNAERSFHKEKRSNETHRSTTDPEARLYKKGDGQPARLCYMGHALMENRCGLAVDGELTLATGTAEREATLTFLDRRLTGRRVTLGADKAGACPRAGEAGPGGRRAVHRRAAGPRGDPSNRGQRLRQLDRPPTPDRNRWPHHPPPRLCRQPALPQADREDLRLAQELGRPCQGEAPRTEEGRCRLHPGSGRLQPDPTAKTAAGGGVKGIADGR